MALQRSRGSSQPALLSGERCVECWNRGGDTTPWIIAFPVPGLNTKLQLLKNERYAEGARLGRYWERGKRFCSPSSGSKAERPNGFGQDVATSVDVIRGQAR